MLRGMKRLRPANEAATAAHALTNELSVATLPTGTTNLVIEEARRLERLQAKRRKLRAELRRLDRDIKHSRKMLRAFAGVTKP
jgi:hypothetical protein